MRGISWLAEELFASQEGVCSVELASFRCWSLCMQVRAQALSDSAKQFWLRCSIVLNGKTLTLPDAPTHPQTCAECAASRQDALGTLTHSMGKSPSRKAVSRSASQQISRLLWHTWPYSQKPITGLSPEANKSSPQSNKLFIQIHFNIILRSTSPISKQSVPLRMPDTLHTNLPPLFPAHITLLDLTMAVTFGEECGF
jgi:hypothetical protein